MDISSPSSPADALAVAWCYMDGLVSHTLPLGDLRETVEELAEDKSLQNSGNGDRGGMQT